MGKIYFASDFHLGVPGKLSSREREKKIVRWLDQIKSDADTIYLVGDIFDFWFEFKTVVPRGYIRLFGKLIELKDQGIDIQIFTGNHDLWMFDYFTTEFEIPVHHKPIEVIHSGKKFFIGHGDGLGPGDYGYKRLKKIFTNPICQWLFARLHPNFSISLALWFSRRSRQTQGTIEPFLGEDKEWLLIYSNKKVEETQSDYFVFGHRHLEMNLALKNGKSRYINLGEWLFTCSYAVFDGQDIQIHYFEKDI